ncbi:fucolectin-7-like [Crassostrea angulata]|uniref:fucolectin-7-like n=1 Tax=Magallana angulata TaxID=2784310 RepID=UPI0022B150E6|nr:fucolectin-7-like [Crassostrea angulata]
MNNLKFILLMIDIFVLIVATQWYELKSTTGFTVSNCTEQQVDSMLSCAAIGRAAKCVTYYFNVYEYLCSWNCKFFENNSHAVGNQGWRKYELKWKENSALGKPVVGSSIFGNNSADWDPSYATDGLVLNRCPKIFHSNFEPSPWIKVDLMNPLTISFIRVFNRPDVLGERFHDVAVEVTNNSDYIQRGFYEGPAATGETVDILCDYPTIARYVRLRITVGSGNSLHIQELEIYTI